MRSAKLVFAGAVLVSTCAAIAQVAPVAGSSASTTSVFRDPFTGRTFQQQLVNVTVPTTVYEDKAVKQTYYEAQQRTSQVKHQQVVYVPQQSYVVETRLRGRWNPFRRPVYTYHYRPVTRWTPTIRDVMVPVTTQQFVPRERTVYVRQPVQRNQVTQQVVTTEIPSSTLPAAVPNQRFGQTLYAMQPQPRIRWPILARQQMLARPPSGMIASALPPRTFRQAPMVATAAPSTYGRSLLGDRMLANNVRPVAGWRPGSVVNPGANYAAPLRTAANPTYSGRSSLQAGMAPTVLR